jgi:hypothetical protein
VPRLRGERPEGESGSDLDFSGDYYKLTPMSEVRLNDIKALFDTPQPAALGPEQRTETQPQAALNTRLDELLQASKLSTVDRQLVRALLLLWHDHLDAAHAISQGIENPDGSFVHAIMHRREPDYSNSKYWFRRVGRHTAFPEIARRVGRLLKECRAGELEKRLLPADNWDAFAFVDACEEAAQDGKRLELLRQIQRIEFEVLLERFAATHGSL